MMCGLISSTHTHIPSTEPYPDAVLIRHAPHAPCATSSSFARAARSCLVDVSSETGWTTSQDDGNASGVAAASGKQRPAHQLPGTPAARGPQADAAEDEHLNNTAHEEQPLRSDAASPACLAATIFEGVKAKIETLQAGGGDTQSHAWTCCSFDVALPAGGSRLSTLYAALRGQ